ncbi:MAG TPA: type II toxin-antitoxin system RelE/ParE family toxin [Paludibaculum sp.]|jgi:plasmid stabilization system protein ParE
MDLNDIWDYIAADRWIEKLFATFEALARSPGIGHQREDLMPQPVLFFPVGSYLIICRYRPRPVRHHHRVLVQPVPFPRNAQYSQEPRDLSQELARLPLHRPGHDHHRPRPEQHMVHHLNRRQGRFPPLPRAAKRQPMRPRIQQPRLPRVRLKP